MTWIRCSDRMPMGEACEVSVHHCHMTHVAHFESATVETLRLWAAEYVNPEMDPPGYWIDRTEWRPLEPSGDSGELDEAEPELEEATLFEAMARHGSADQLAMLQEECGELVAAVNRYRRGRPGAFEAMIDEMADVSILIDQMHLVYGAEIDAARARKVARLRERLGR